MEDMVVGGQRPKRAFRNAGDASDSKRLIDTVIDIINKAKGK